MTAKELGDQPAYPTTANEIEKIGDNYLAKRELFAMASMQGLRSAKLLSDTAYSRDGANTLYPERIWSPKSIAALAVRDADALLAELAKDQL